MRNRIPTDDDIRPVDKCIGRAEECNGHVLIEIVAMAIQMGSMELIHNNKVYITDWDDDQD